MITFITLVLLVIGALVYILQDAKAEIELLTKKLKEKDREHEIEKAKVKKESTFRSSAVNWGKTIEHFVPFMTKFPIPAEDVVFLGMPIDYVGFTDTDDAKKCEVHFIEVKSGNSILMGKQRNIKKAIQEGRVNWHEIAVDGNRTEEI
jgi:predicted Holliday junction resolvase-like endonuclease